MCLCVCVWKGLGAGRGEGAGSGEGGGGEMSVCSPANYIVVIIFVFFVSKDNLYRFNLLFTYVFSFSHHL